MPQLHNTPPTAPHSAPQTTEERRFTGFYQQVFLPEHQHPGIVALHVLGTVAGLAFVAAIFTSGLGWWAPPLLLLFPVVHAAPGLLGHRLWGRNPVVGDTRVMNTDYPPLWFIVCNHRMTLELMLKGFYWRARQDR
jgi:hypothetical protein